MFIGREHELSVLNKLYMSDKFVRLESMMG